VNNRPKILVIENSVAVTGALYTVLRTSVSLRNQYEFVFILPTKSKAASTVEENNFKLYQVPLYELRKNILSVLLYVPRLIRSVYQVRMIAKNERISIVHVSDFYNLIMPLWRVCGGKLPYICYVNFVPDRFPMILRKLWINSHMFFAAKIVAVSQHVLKQLPMDEKVICIPDSLPLEDTMISIETVEKKNTILFLGNYISGKGQDLAIQAFASIAPKHPNWKLKMVGGDMGLEKNKIYKNGLKHLADKLGVKKQIEIGDFTKDVAREYREADIALNFSISESFSLTVQEAMFYGCPIIATRSGGPSELIEDEFSGLLIPVNDIEKMSASIEYLIENPSERERLSVHAKQSIRERYDRKATIDLLDQTYQNVLRPY
jgi:L-malate glycosyltransferase